MPGTSKGHQVHWRKDGTLYKHRKLRELADQDAVTYTMQIQHAIASAALSELTWVDDDAQVYARAGLASKRVMISDGRKLRLLSAYHPDDVLPISSSEHIRHFLTELGYATAEIPSVKKPVERMMLLKKVYEEARRQVPTLTVHGFMHALYSAELGLAPVKETAPEEAAEVEETGAESAEDVADINDIEAPASVNTILQGPPGTGKTYATIDEALRVLDPEFLEKNAEDRDALKERYDELADAKRIRFVTFHQSFSYEDFVEGIRPDTDNSGAGQIRYVVGPGIFRQICEAASIVPKQDVQLGVGTSPRLWKISINGTGQSSTRQHCFTHGEAPIGWGHVGDLRNADLTDPDFKLGSNDRSTLGDFSQNIQPGDIVLCIANATEVNAVGVVQGEYRHEEEVPAGVRVDYKNVLPVKWLATGLRYSILELNASKRFTLKTVYEIDRFSWPELRQALLAGDVKMTDPDKQQADVPRAQIEPYVLIIDEINRGNVSRIFGELITLIEPSKRIGAQEALYATLPYSRKRFGVPVNVHLIGTMNTADRSLTGLDIALRRRFVFKEMPPQPELLDGVLVEDIDIGRMLRIMNERIEVLLDRDHCLGHAYFLPLKRTRKLDQLAAIFQQNVLPLLQEYFFDDAERIGWVLNDPNAPQAWSRSSDPTSRAGARFRDCSVRRMPPRCETTAGRAHHREARVDGAPLALVHLVHGGAHVVVEPAARHAAQRRERSRVRIEQHLVTLAWIHHQPEGPTRAQLHVRRLQLAVDAPITSGSSLQSN
jgi:5-methylcytosine-specific restriction protein B